MGKQEQFWSGPAGVEYAKRSPGNEIAMRQFWENLLKKNRDLQPRKVIEFGAGVGTNLKTLQEINGKIHRTGVEINPESAKVLANHCETLVISPLAKLKPLPTVGLTYTRGVLIHIPEDELDHALKLLYESSHRWVMVIEYYSPRRMPIPYRGEEGLLWKDDFAGRMMTMYPTLRLIDYGFIYHRDPVAPQDDVTYFLMQKP